MAIINMSKNSRPKHENNKDGNGNYYKNNEIELLELKIQYLK